MKRQTLLIFPLLLLVAAAVFLTVLAIDAQPLVLLKPGDAAACTENFMNAVAAGDLAAARSCLYGTVDLHESDDSGRAAAALRDAARTGFSYAVSEEMSASGMAVEIPVSIRYLPLTDLQTALEQKSPRPSGEDSLCQAIRELAGSHIPARTAQLTVKLVREDGRWQIIPEQSLLDLLTGQVIS